MLCTAAAVQAKTITLTSTLTCTVTPSQLNAELTIKNEGEESAHNIWATFVNGDKIWISDITAELKVDQLLRIEYQEKLDMKLQGTYTLIAKILYQDAAGYPLSTIVVNPFVYGEAAISSVFGQLEDLKLSSRGNLDLRLTNSDHNDLVLNISIFVPDELSAFPTQGEYFIGAMSEKTYRVKLENFSALVGSTYPAWAVIEHDNEDHHSTQVCSAAVQIIDKPNVFQEYWWLWITLLTILTALFVWLNVKK